MTKARVGSASVQDWVGENRKILASLVGLAFFALGGASFYRSQQDAKAAKGKDALYAAEKKIEEALKGLAPAPQQPPADSAKSERPAPKPPTSASFKKLDVDQTFGKALAELKEVTATYAGTRPAFEALVRMGDLYFDHGNLAAALPLYEKAVSAAGSAMDREFARLAVAYSQEGMNQNEAALSSALKVSESGVDATLAAEASLFRGRLLARIQKVDDAKKAFEKVAALAPGTELARRAESAKSLLSP